MDKQQNVRFIRVKGRVIPITDAQHKNIQRARKEHKTKKRTQSNAYLAFGAASMYGQVNTVKRNFTTSGSIKDKTFRMNVKKKPKSTYNWGPDKYAYTPNQQVRIGKAPRRMNFRIKGSSGLYKSLAVAGAASGILGSMSNKYQNEKEKGFSKRGLAAGVGSAAAAGFVGLVHGVNSQLQGIAKASRSPMFGKYANRWATAGGTPLALASAGVGAAAYNAINKRKKGKAK